MFMISVKTPNLGVSPGFISVESKVGIVTECYIGNCEAVGWVSSNLIRVLHIVICLTKRVTIY